MAIQSSLSLQCEVIKSDEIEFELNEDESLAISIWVPEEHSTDKVLKAEVVLSRDSVLQLFDFLVEEG